MSIQVQWLGHSCFRATCGDYALVLDPFAPGSVPGLRDVGGQADQVLCSHEHYDHNYREGFTLRKERECPFTVTRLDSFHDDTQGSQRGPNVITVLEAEGRKLVHFGDIGCMPTAEQMERLRGADVILLPVGGHFTVGPREAKAIADAAAARTVVPMHYRSPSFGFDVIGPVEDFLALYPGFTRADTDTLTLGEDLPAGVVVLSYR